MNIKIIPSYVLIILIIMLSFTACVIGYLASSLMNRPSNMDVYTSQGLYHINYSDMFVTEESSDTLLEFKSYLHMSEFIENTTYRDFMISESIPTDAFISDPMSCGDSLLVLVRNERDILSGHIHDTIGYVLIDINYMPHFYLNH